VGAVQWYTRSQLTLVLAIALAAGGGYGVSLWRQAYPALAERLEQFDRRPDRDPAPGRRFATQAEAVAIATDGTGARSARPRDDGASRRGDAAGRPRSTPRDRTPRAATPESGRAERGGVVAGPIDVNRASADELARLPGVGRTLAARIVATREAEGPFASVDDLRRVPGLGRARVDRLRPHVVSE
jgi:competence ComEA-like helix-hairpin-helix protein